MTLVRIVVVLIGLFMCLLTAITPTSAGYFDSQGTKTGNHSATKGQLLWQFETGG
jgi:hypothetical protein